MTFKFFRKYNKWLMAVGVSLLMVVFLIEGAVPMLTQQNPDKIIVGSLHGKPVTLTQQMRAGADFDIVTMIADPQNAEVLLNPSGLGETPREVFTLFLLEANRIGIHPSPAEAYQTLNALGINELQLKLLAAQRKWSPEEIIHAVQSGLAVQTYINLVNGQVGGNASRLSEPMIQRLVYDVSSTATATGVLLPAEKAVSAKPVIAEAQLTKLFDQYKNDLPGQSKPYGFGYKTPSLVQIEYLEVPGALVSSKVKVDEVEMQDFYDKNHKTIPFFTVQPENPNATQPAAPVYKPYDQVAGDIREHLKAKKADELADKIIRFAASALAQNTQTLADQDGYKVLPEGFKPIPLEMVLNQIKTQFGITPTVRIEGDQWFDSKSLSALKGIPSSYLPSRRDSIFSDYVMSARELDPAKDNPYLALRLQVGLPSAPLSSFDHSRYIFRLIGAQKAQVPSSLDKAKLAVARDAEKLATWELIQKDPQAILAKAAAQPSMEAYAKSLGMTEIKLIPFPRKNRQQGRFTVPFLPQIGQNEAFVDAVFSKALDLSAKGPIEKAPFKDRLIAVPLEDQMSVAVFSVDSLQAPSKIMVDGTLSNPQIGLILEQAINVRLDRDFVELKKVQQRLNYEPKGSERAAPVE